MACYLRVFGESLDIDALLGEVGIEPDRVWRKGERRFPNNPESRIHEHSGASFTASAAGMDEFDLQVADSSEFLEQHKADIVRMVGFLGVEGVTLDFGVELRDVAIHSDFLTPRFIKAAGAAGIAVELSHYPRMEEEPRES